MAHGIIESTQNDTLIAEDIRAAQTMTVLTLDNWIIEAQKNELGEKKHNFNEAKLIINSLTESILKLMPVTASNPLPQINKRIVATVLAEAIQSARRDYGDKSDMELAIKIFSDALGVRQQTSALTLSAGQIIEPKRVESPDTEPPTIKIGPNIPISRGAA